MKTLSNLFIFSVFTTVVFAQAPSVLPAESILEDPITISDLTANSASLVLNTTLDVACLVVFGTDESFGQMAFDQDMGADAHQNHFVIMRGLEPDTEYVYRLQGSDTAGNFYASEIMSFRTPADSSVSLGTNLAQATQGATVTAVSSNFGGGDNSSRWGANNAIDGNADTEWSSAGDGNEAFITVQLAQNASVSGFGLWTRTMGSSAEISQFEVTNEAGEVFGPFNIPNATGIYDFPVEASGQSFTFRVIDSSGGNTGVVEVAVYGE